MPLPPHLTPTAVLDILLVAFLIYQFLSIVQGRRAAHVLGGVGVLILVYAASVFAGLELVRSLLATLAPYTAFALIVMFQSEIRRILSRMGRGHSFGFGRRLQQRESAHEVIFAVEELSKQKAGALIVLEREIGLKTFIESGIPLDACLSRDLLVSIFQKTAPMHDGAAVVQGDRIAAAACFLPLTMNPEQSRKLGTRHRAALGVTEETDCLAIVVSEETGRVSLAAFGQFEFDINLERLAERFAQHFARQKQGRTQAPIAEMPVRRDDAAGLRRVGRS